jgi:hypothetical protein
MPKWKMMLYGIPGKTDGRRVNIAFVKTAILVGRSLVNPGIVVVIAASASIGS